MASLQIHKFMNYMKINKIIWKNSKISRLFCIVLCVQRLFILNIKIKCKNAMHESDAVLQKDENISRPRNIFSVVYPIVNHKYFSYIRVNTSTI